MNTIENAVIKHKLDIKLFILLLFFKGATLSAQSSSEILYILDNEPTVTTDHIGKTTYFFSKKSENTEFNNDAFLFAILNQIGFDEYASLDVISQDVNLETINYEEVENLTSFDPWTLHNYLSTKKSIYLIVKHQNNDSKNIYSRFVKYPMKYEGTQKNIEFLRLD